MLIIVIMNVLSVNVLGLDINQCSIMQNQGEKFYRSNNFKEAIQYFSDSIDCYTTTKKDIHNYNQEEYDENLKIEKLISKSLYYQGMSYLYLEDYANSLTCLNKVHIDDMELCKKAIYQIAGIYSLTNKHQKCMMTLLKYYSQNSGNIDNIRNEKPFKSFCTSEYYREFQKALAHETSGLIPKNKKDITKYLFTKCIDCIYLPSPGSVDIRKDGTFVISLGTNVYPAGFWNINDNSKTLTFILSGEITFNSYLEGNTFKQNERYKNFKENDFFGSGKSRIWLYHDKNPYKVIIPFNNIRLNKRSINVTLDEKNYYYSICNTFGKPNKIIYCGLCSYEKNVGRIN